MAMDVDGWRKKIGHWITEMDDRDLLARSIGWKRRQNDCELSDLVDGWRILAYRSYRE